QFDRTLDASAGEGMFQQVLVKIRLAGRSEHDLLVSYVSAAPMWKPTYRVVLPDGGKGKALLQAWAVVDNTSGEDWRQVELGLTSGAPIAFRYDLHTPREVPRPDLTEVGVQRRAEAMVGESSFEPEPATEMSASMADEVEEDRDDRAAKKSRSVSRPAPASGAAAEPSRALPPAPPTLDRETLRRSTRAQARAATVAGQTRFDLADRVTVPDGTSTMVAIVNADVDGEESFLFRPGGSGMGY